MRDLAVAAYGLDRATIHGLLAELLLLGSLRLFEDEAVAAVIIAFEVRRGRLTAEITIDALIIHVKLAPDVVAVFVCCVCHSFLSKKKCLKSPPLPEIAIVF